MNVAMVAYACAPAVGSEAGTGWEWARAAAERHETWLLTRTNNRAAIEAELASRPVPGLHPVYVDLGATARRLKRLPGALWPYYLLWQRTASDEVARLHFDVGFDVAHHITFATDWLPTGLSRLDIPLVWGPVGGATGTPTWARTWMTWSEHLREVSGDHLKRVMRHAVTRSLPAGALVVPQNREGQAAFSSRDLRCAEPEVHVAIEGSALPVHTAEPRARRAVFVGRLIAWKGCALAIDVVEQAPLWTLDIIGDGPERRRLERVVRTRGLPRRIRFHGNISRESALLHVAGANALLATAFHEQGGWAVAEATAIGTPVVCLRRGGPGVLVRDGHGSVVEGRHDLVARLAAALETVTSIGPDRRWDRSRLPDTLDRWYESATASPS